MIIIVPLPVRILQLHSVQQLYITPRFILKTSNSQPIAPLTPLRLSFRAPPWMGAVRLVRFRSLWLTTTGVKF